MKNKTLNRIVGPCLGLTVTLILCISAFHAARGADFGTCTEEVLSPPTETSLSVNIKGLIQYPDTPVCPRIYEGIGEDGRTYRWYVGLLGDGLVDMGVNVTVVFGYEGDLGKTELTLNLYAPFPSDAFNIRILSDPDLRTPEEGPACHWDDTLFVTDGGLPLLSFGGVVSLDSSGNLTVDITFTGRTPSAPALAIGNLIAFVEGSEAIEPGMANALVASLEAALASVEAGNMTAAQNQLNAFIHKVEAVRGKKVVDADADYMMAAAEVIWDGIE